MKKQIIRLTEQDIARIVETTVNEINWGKTAKVGASVLGGTAALALGGYDDAQTHKAEQAAWEMNKEAEQGEEFMRQHENAPMEDDDATYMNPDWKYESKRPRKITETTLRRALRSSLKKVLG